MQSFYVYLISTLPTLYFGAKPAFSFEKFIHYCQRFIGNAEIKILRNVSITGEYDVAAADPTLKKWQEFDTSLRNELVRMRAARKHLDPLKYLRNDQFPEAFISRLSQNSQRSPGPLDAQRMLDQGRWGFLDELSFGHYFDLGFLIIYALKLLILERWERINTADKAGVLEEAIIST